MAVQVNGELIQSSRRKIRTNKLYLSSSTKFCSRFVVVLGICIISFSLVMDKPKPRKIFLGFKLQVICTLNSTVSLGKFQRILLCPVHQFWPLSGILAWYSQIFCVTFYGNKPIDLKKFSSWQVTTSSTTCEVIQKRLKSNGNGLKKSAASARTFTFWKRNLLKLKVLRFSVQLSGHIFQRTSNHAQRPP